MNNRDTEGCNVGEQSNRDFDKYADDYEQTLNAGLAISGEELSYFAEGRLRWMLRRFHQMSFRVGRMLDYGCGTGATIPLHFSILKAESLLGLDPSEESLTIARALNEGAVARFGLPESSPPAADMDLAYCNGVFHHVRPADRGSAARAIYEYLTPGGLFAFWENNPWNPVTRYVMSKVPFDREAIMIWPANAKALLRNAGFEILSLDYLFFFPAFLKSLRVIEPSMCKIPLGGQYFILARRPGL